MESVEKIKERLKKGGYTLISEYNDAANEFFPDHDHPGDELLVVVSGEIGVTMDGKKYSLKPGDELFFPAKLTHNATIGNEGCFYIVGEKGP